MIFQSLVDEDMGDFCSVTLQASPIRTLWRAQVSQAPVTRMTDTCHRPARWFVQRYGVAASTLAGLGRLQKIITGKIVECVMVIVTLVHWPGT